VNLTTTLESPVKGCRVRWRPLTKGGLVRSRGRWRIDYADKGIRGQPRWLRRHQDADAPGGNSRVFLPDCTRLGQLAR